MSYLHDRGVLHLDLKPSNVIAEAGRAKIIDPSLTAAPGRMKAGIDTWAYMAPEQTRGGNVGPQARPFVAQLDGAPEQASGLAPAERRFGARERARVARAATG